MQATPPTSTQSPISGHSPDVANKVKLGFFSFTEVLDGRHREYNEWHLFDHMPENFKLEGLHWGQRWVATPELTERRLFSQGDLAKTQYVTLYLITEPVSRALDDFYALGRTLYAQGRWFEDTDGRTIRIYWLDEAPEVFLDDLKAKTPDMAMIDLSKAYSTLVVGAYQSIPWDSKFDWFD